MKNKIVNLAVLSLILTFTGCNIDRTFVLELIIENKLEEEISVEISDFAETGSTVTIDTSYHVLPKSSLRIFLSNPRGMARDVYPDNFYLFSSIKVFKEDGQMSGKEFADRDKWSFTRISEEYAIYTLVIDESDF